jgi:hypothetical protein
MPVTPAMSAVRDMRDPLSQVADFDWMMLLSDAIRWG